MSAVHCQDWGPAFVPVGVTGGVELVGFDRATLIGEQYHNLHCMKEAEVCGAWLVRLG